MSAQQLLRPGTLNLEIERESLQISLIALIGE